MGGGEICICKLPLKATNLELLRFSCILVSARGWGIRVVTGQEQPGLRTLFVCHPAEVWDDPLLVGSVRMRVSTLLEIEDTTSCCNFTSSMISKSELFLHYSSYFQLYPNNSRKGITALLARLKVIPPWSSESIKIKLHKKVYLLVTAGM